MTAAPTMVARVEEYLSLRRQLGFALQSSGQQLLGFARYRMPIDGLYLCGSGAHPGGGITGAPGQNAAREILADLKSRRR